MTQILLQLICFIGDPGDPVINLICLNGGGEGGEYCRRILDAVWRLLVCG